MGVKTSVTLQLKYTQLISHVPKNNPRFLTVCKIWIFITIKQYNFR